MDIELKWIKELPIEQINKFEDKVVYNTALYTREYTKSSQAYPYLTGELQRSEVSMPIQSTGIKEYGLGAGVDYAVDVWKKTHARWTNPNTLPQWYYSIFKKYGATIVSQAVYSSLKEI